MLKYVLAFVLAFCGTANAQLNGGLQFPGPGAIAALPPSIAFTGHSETSPATTNRYTFSSLTIAPGLVALVFGTLDSGLGVTTGATLDSGGGAVAMTKIAEAYDNGATIVMYQLVVASGTSATVVLSFTNSTASSDSAVVDAYSITGYSSATPTTMQVNGSGADVSLNGSLASTSGGVGVVGAMQRTTSASTGIIGGLASPTIDRNCYQVLGFSCNTTDHYSGLTTATNSVTATWNGSPRASVLAGAAWR